MIHDWTRIVFLKVWETSVLLLVEELFEMSEVSDDITESETEHIQSVYSAKSKEQFFLKEPF